MQVGLRWYSLEMHLRTKLEDTLNLDVPLADSYDRKYLPAEGAEVSKVAIEGRIEQDGIESLHIEAPTRKVAFTDELFRAMNFGGLRDGWVRDVLVDNTTEGIDVGGDTSRITIQNVLFRHTTTITSSAKPSDFALRGTQILVLRCGSIGNDLFYVITGPRNQGPNVVLNSRFIAQFQSARTPSQFLRLDARVVRIPMHWCSVRVGVRRSIAATWPTDSSSQRARS